jgi:enamine deaminase RidA (YjgF/YER057c/UK114 family)
MAARQNISSGAPWEALVGYSRAVRVGQSVYVSGTVASDENGQVVGPGDPYAQAVYVLRKIETALAQAGATMGDVVRTRMYLTDIGNWQTVTRAHAEVFAAIRPAATLVAVAALISPEYLVEIEVDAVIGAGGEGT